MQTPKPSPSDAMAVASGGPSRVLSQAVGGCGDGPTANSGRAVPSARRSGVVSAAALTQKIAALDAAVASGKAREAAQGRRTAELEADNARLSVEVTAFRNRPRLPTPSDGAQAAGRGRSASTSKFGGTACWSCIVLVCIVPVRG